MYLSSVYLVTSSSGYIHFLGILGVTRGKTGYDINNYYFRNTSHRKQNKIQQTLCWSCSYSLMSMTSHRADFLCAGKGSLQAANLYQPAALTTEDILMCRYAQSVPTLQKRALAKGKSVSCTVWCCSDRSQVSFTFEPREQSLQPCQGSQTTKPLSFTFATSPVFSPKEKLQALSFDDIPHKMYTTFMNHHLKLTSVSCECKKIRFGAKHTATDKEIL